MRNSHKALLFLALTFVLTWGVQIAGWGLGASKSPGLGLAVIFTSMFGPAVAALICAVTFEKGQRLAALGLSFRPNRFWLLAWAIPLGLASTSVAFTLLLTDIGFTDPAAQTIAAVAAQAGAAKADQLRALPWLSLAIIGGAICVGPLINTLILTFSEELGWRGYLHHLWRPSGFWRASLATGVIWGIWHAPVILLFGHNYPDDRGVGAILFVGFCTLLAPIMTWLRDRGASVWAAGIAHGTINAFGSLTVLALGNAAFPWNGLIGIGGFLALAFGVGTIAMLAKLPRRTQIATG